MTLAMQGSFVTFKYVCTRITLRHNCKVDQTCCRAIHNCDDCVVQQCGAIHYGQCRAINVPSKVLQSSANSLNQSQVDGTREKVKSKIPPFPDSRYTVEVKTKPRKSVYDNNSLSVTIKEGPDVVDQGNYTQKIKQDNGALKYSNVVRRVKPYQREQINVTVTKSDKNSSHPPVHNQQRPSSLHIENRYSAGQYRQGRPLSLNLENYRKSPDGNRRRPLSLNIERRHSRMLFELVTGEKAPKSPTRLISDAVWPKSPSEPDRFNHLVVDDGVPRPITHRVHVSHDSAKSAKCKEKLPTSPHSTTITISHRKKSPSAECADTIYNNLESYLNKSKPATKKEHLYCELEPKLEKFRVVQEHLYSELKPPEEPIYATIGAKEKDKKHVQHYDINLTPWSKEEVYDNTKTESHSDETYDNTLSRQKSRALSHAELQAKENKEKAQTSKQSYPPLNLNIPQFYFPMGRPALAGENEMVLQKVAEVFNNAEGGKIYRHQMDSISKACNLPLFWKCPLFIAAGGDKHGYITLNAFTQKWSEIIQSWHDEASRFVKLMAKPGCNFLVPDDFILLMQDIVDCHPGLTFLQDAPEFHSRYIHTVISRIFYTINRSWTGRITIAEMRRSNFLQTLSILEDEEDINQVTDFFSYEHFYVIYCKFWELDKDHDLLITKDDLSKHNEHAISSRMIDRIFSGAVTRGKHLQEGKMTYTEFVWFLISEEDKKQPTSIEYWFRCMDMDGDGVLSMYELDFFYEEMIQKMEAMGIEPLPFNDCLCQMLDLVKPRDPNKITLRDLKVCKQAYIFFDTFFNLDKYLDHEQRDPFANARDIEQDGPEPSDWEKFAAEEYEILVAEEGANDNEGEIAYEDDFEPEEDELQALENLKLSDPPKKNIQSKSGGGDPNDDIYDFSTEGLGY